MESLDVPGLAVTRDEERMPGGEAPQAGLDARVHLTAELGDELIVLELGLGDERENVRLGETGEDLANALVVRFAGDAPDVVLGNRPEGNAVPVEPAGAPDGARRGGVAQ